VGSEVLRIDLLCFLTGCRKKATKPGCLYLFLNIVFFYCVVVYRGHFLCIVSYVGMCSVFIVLV